MDVIELSLLQQLGLAVIVGSIIFCMLIEHAEMRRVEREKAYWQAKTAAHMVALREARNAPVAVQERTRQFDRVIDWTK